jgi:hypothetical protein
MDPGSGVITPVGFVGTLGRVDGYFVGSSVHEADAVHEPHCRRNGTDLPALTP